MDTQLRFMFLNFRLCVRTNLRVYNSIDYGWPLSVVIVLYGGGGGGWSKAKAKKLVVLQQIFIQNAVSQKRKVGGG